MDLSSFADSFFEEAEELLGDMERFLLELDLDQPDPEQLNAIFRAAHSMKGGAGIFGFTVLQETTHILENLLDDARKDKLQLTSGILDLFLRAKDTLHDQLQAYRQQAEPDAEAFQSICAEMRQVGEAGVAAAPTAAPAAAPAPAAPAPSEAPEVPEVSSVVAAAVAEAPASDDPIDRMARVLQQLACEALREAGKEVPALAVEPVAAAQGAGSDALLISLLNVPEKDRVLLLEELGHLGELRASAGDEKRYEVTLATQVEPDAIEAVLCFIVEPEQVEIRPAPAAAPAAPVVAEPPKASEPKPADKTKAAGKPRAAAASNTESATIRVHTDKVDQIINLVGELIITQSMLDQTQEGLDGERKAALIAGLNQLQRNARDLQEAVMSIRMLPMDYVFSRFPRQVRDLAGRLDKEVELVLEGKSTELDKGLIERITDPLTHLVRNSLDHGIETPDKREQAGKPRCGRLLLSARHQGGSIIIEVEDDGAGLNRERLLAKARSNGLPVSDDMRDEDVWQLIFAPGFSTAEQVSDVSGRGVGMDVVRRNIQSMGGHVEIMSRAGQGTTTRVVLPLTLAILDGMSLRVGEEMFVLPLASISELVQPTEDNLFTMAGEDVLLKVRDQYLPIVVLRDVMDVPGPQLEMEESIAIIVQGEESSYALLVDEPVGQQQVVVKNLESNYRKVPGVSGATILGDGRVALILDALGLQRCDHSKKKHFSRLAKRPQVPWEVMQS